MENDPSLHPLDDPLFLEANIMKAKCTRRKIKITLICSSSKEVKELTIPNSSVFFINSDKFTIDAVYVPLEINKMIDFVVLPFFIQATIHRSHDIKKGLTKVAAQFPHIEDWYYCFILPKHRYDSFGHQRDYSSVQPQQCKYLFNDSFESPDIIITLLLCIVL